MGDPYDPPLNIELHAKYWRRCFRSLLPHHYLSMEATRMALAFFMVGAADLLPSPGPPSAADDAKSLVEPLVRPADKPLLRQWVLAQQHSSGGFCGSPSVAPPASMHEEWNFADGTPGQERSPFASVFMTAFALQMLAALADEDNAGSAFAGVDRIKTLRWLRRLQRPDGSFGEALVELPGKGWFIGGGYDMRYCYLAAMVRWMLRGDVKEGDPEWVEDFDTEKLVKYISSTQTYDGGLAGSQKDEPHSGYAYCAVSALSLLDRPLEGGKVSEPSKAVQAGIRDIPALVHWLASRQFVYLEPSEDEDDDEEDNPVHPASLDDLILDEKTSLVGFNGRCNKVADTCYTWWAAGTLANLGYDGLIQVGPARRFLLQKTQHVIGGFGKKAGSPPDVYHSFMGLAALSVLGDPSLNAFDATLAVTVETAKKIEKARKGLLGGSLGGASVEGSHKKLQDLEAMLSGPKQPSWLDAIGA
ncbi:prenyltransferase and squalene oxidase [Thozetella sp. PMI_491]|nr:prenyltransferase and squalene oxidase [Thozetella sp. PMI_491]